MPADNTEQDALSLLETARVEALEVLESARLEAKRLEDRRFEQRMRIVEDHQITYNREMGEVRGELKWIRWLLMGVLGGIIADIVLPYIRIGG